MTVKEGDLLWRPDEASIRRTNLYRYRQWLRERGVADCEDYQELWRWSVDHSEDFWASLWDWFDIQSDAPYTEVCDSREMKPGIRWFSGSRVNFAEHILRHEDCGRIAIHSLSELRPLAKLGWADLASQVRILATRMRDMGVEPGDRIACLMPSLPETVVAMLASISIGAVWSNAAPEFGRSTILDRFGQIRPKWLFIADGYRFGGKDFDRGEENLAVVDALADSLEQVVFLPYLDPEQEIPPELAGVAVTAWEDMLAGFDPGADGFRFERVASDHPLWVLYSSGTTGLPKAIVHSHIGALMVILLNMSMHTDLQPDDINFFYTTTGWMVFTMLVSSLLGGAGIILYDGHPAHPGPDLLWQLAADTGATSFGASPTYVQIMSRYGIVPRDRYDLSRLRTITCTGSPVTPENFAWFYENVGEDIWVTSQSGGTELVGAFVTGARTEPVYAGEIQVRCLVLTCRPGTSRVSRSSTRSANWW